jgi:catalase
VLERRNDYVQARGRYCTMMDWERDDLVLNMGTLLAECERDVQERMVWHFFMVHDDYGKRVGDMLGIGAEDSRKLGPLPKQVLTDEDKRRLEKLGNNGDAIDPNVWGQWTSSVENRQATAEEVLGVNPANEGMRRQSAAE